MSPRIGAQALARLAVLAGILLSLLGSSARAQGNAGRPPFRYGIVVNSSADYPEVAKLGFGYIKLYISWSSIEATPGVFTNYPDYAVQQALANNLQIVALINDAPGWAIDSGANPSPAYANASGTVAVTGYVVDPTASVDLVSVLASLDAPWSSSAQSLPATFDASGNFTVQVDVTHAAMQSTPHQVYVYALTAPDGWVAGIQGLTASPQMNVTPESLALNVNPTSSLTASATLTLGRNDGNPQPYGCTATSSQGWLQLNPQPCPGSWPMLLTVTAHATGLPNGAYPATITLTWLSGGAIWFTNSPVVVPVTLVVGAPPPVRALIPVVYNQQPSGLP